MVRFITKKGEDGKNRHIPIESGSGSRRHTTHRYGLTVKADRSSGDLEYAGIARSPEDAISSVKKHVYSREFAGVSPDDIWDEYFYYTPNGKAISEKEFNRDGGSFDIIAAGPSPSKFQVNAEVTWKSGHWAISGIGNWMDGRIAAEEPENRRLYREGAEKKERKQFEKEYGKKKGDYVYGATVGKVRKERQKHIPEEERVAGPRALFD